MIGASSRRALLLAALAVALLFAGAALKSIWRGWDRGRPERPPAPARVDPGASIGPGLPVAGEPARPALPPSEVPPRPLTRRELAEQAAKYGLVLAPAEAASGRERADPRETRPLPQAEDRSQGPGEPRQPAAGRGGFLPGSIRGSGPDEPAVGYPRLLAEERSCQSPELGRDGAETCPKTSAQVDVSAWQLEPGAPADLRFAWREREREPCPDSGLFGLPAKWRRIAGVGLDGVAVRDEDGETITDGGLVVGGGVAFDAARVGPFTLSAWALGGARIDPAGLEVRGGSVVALVGVSF